MNNYQYFDYEIMQQALKLADKAKIISKPNPAVGCILTKNNRIIGEGFTQFAGSDHAEIQALHDAEKNGESTKNATAYVTLEPCSHHGRTPPCTNALIKAGIKRVIIAVPDPNPKVRGQGIELLEQAGIETSVGLMREESIKKNIGFFKRMLLNRPWIRLKIATTLDGKTALNNSQSKWITNQKARNDGHAWRARACAILTGIGTIQSDDPELNARVTNSSIVQPQRIVLDSNLSINLNAKILRGDPAPWIICGNHSLLHTEKAQILKNLKIKILALPLNVNQNKVDLASAIKYLGQQSFNEIHVEAGMTLNGSLLERDLIDELLIYIAPITFGNIAKGIFQCPELSSIKKAKKWTFESIENLDENLRIIAMRNQNYIKPWLLFRKFIADLEKR